MTEEQRKVSKPIAVALSEILSEARRAARKHPPLNSPHEGYAVLLEEVDELKAEIWKRNRDPVAMRAEAIQVGAMALRFIVDVCGGK